MRRATRRLVPVVLVFIVLIIVFVLTLRHTEPATMAKLQFTGYATNPNGVKSAVLMLTNPGPAHLDYSAHNERGGTNAFIANGTVVSRSTITFQIPLSDRPSRLLINCATRHSLRDLADDVSSFVGLKTPSRSSEYTLYSEELIK